MSTRAKDLIPKGYSQDIGDHMPKRKEAPKTQPGTGGGGERQPPLRPPVTGGGDENHYTNSGDYSKFDNRYRYGNGSKASRDLSRNGPNNPNMPFSPQQWNS